MNKNLLKTAFLSLGLLVGSMAWAQDYTAIYQRVAEPADDPNVWTEADLTDWTTDGATLTLGSYDTTDEATGEVVSTTYLGLGIDNNTTFSTTKTFEGVEENALLKYEVDWYFGSSTGRAQNYSYLQFGDKVRISWNNAYRLYVNTDGASSADNMITEWSGRNSQFTAHIVLVFNTATRTVDEFTMTIGDVEPIDLSGYVGTSALEGSFNSVTMGFIRGGSVNWTCPKYITNITVSQAQQSVSFAPYTINYQIDGTTISTTTDEGVIGSNIDLTKVIYGEDGTKYMLPVDGPQAVTVAESGNEFNIAVRKAYAATLVVNKLANGETIASDTTQLIEADDYTTNYAYYYPMYVADAAGKYYGIEATTYGETGTFTDGEAIVKDVNYTVAADDVVYFVEGEALGQGNDLETGNAALSGGAGDAMPSVNGSTMEPTFPAGFYSYTVSVVANPSRCANLHALVNTNRFEYLAEVNATGVTTIDFALTTPTQLVVSGWTTTSGTNSDNYNQSARIDYVIIRSTMKSAENIAALSTLTDGTPVTLTLSEAAVTFVKGDTAFIQDATGAIMTNGLGLTEGTVLNGTVVVTYNATEGQLPVLNANEATNAEGYYAVESTFTPALVKLDELQNNLSAYVGQVIRIMPSDFLVAMGGNMQYVDYTEQGGPTVIEDEFMMNSVAISDDYSVLPEDYTWPAQIGNLIVVVGVNGVSPVSAEKIYAPGEGFGTVVESIAAMKEVANQEAVALTLNNAQVTFAMQNMLGQSTLIIEDATGAAQILSEAMAWSPYPEPDIQTTFPEAFGTVGNVLNGTLYGKFVNEWGSTGIAYNNYTTMSTVNYAAGTLNPTVMTIPEAQAPANSWRLIRLENVTIAYDEANWAYTISDGTNTMTYNDMFGLMVDMDTYEYITGDFAYVDGLLYYDTTLDEPAYAFYPTGSYAAVPEQSYKSFEATEVLAGDQATIEAAVAEGWVVAGSTFVTNKRGNIDINTGEVVDATQMPGVGVKDLGHSSKYLYTYVTNVSEVVAYASSTSSSATRTLHVEATPTDGTDVVTATADAAPNVTGVATLALDPAKEYEIVYYATETKDDGSIAGGDMVVFGVKFVVVEAQSRVWDFTSWSTATIDNLTADAADVEDVSAAETGWRTFEKNGGPTETDPDKGGACFWYGSLISEPMELTANGVVIAETKGLLFNNVENTNNTIGIAVNYPETSIGTYHGASYLWLNGGGRQITIPAVKPGSTIKMGVESHRNGSGRGVDLSVDGAQFASCTPDAYEEYEWTVPTSEAETVDVLAQSNSGCHIYFIEVINPSGEADGIEAINPVQVQNDNVYTLGGVMVRKAGQSLEGLAKGIYIKGGKKIVVK